MPLLPSDLQHPHSISSCDQRHQAGGDLSPEPWVCSLLPTRGCGCGEAWAWGQAPRPAYLSPVAEHLSVSSVGHKLLGKLGKTWCHLRWWLGRAGKGLLGRAAPHPALGSMVKVTDGPLRKSGGSQGRWGRGGEAQGEQPMQEHQSICDWGEGQSWVWGCLGTHPGVNARGPSVVRFLKNIFLD